MQLNLRIIAQRPGQESPLFRRGMVGMQGEGEPCTPDLLPNTPVFGLLYRAVWMDGWMGHAVRWWRRREVHDDPDTGKPQPSQ